MAIQLDHAIVPSRRRLESAPFLAELLGVPWADGHFAAVYVNDSLTLDFAEGEEFESHHFCFRVSDEEFDAIFARLQAAHIPYRSRPHGENDLTINRRLGGKNVYWEDADGHVWEMLTVSYARPATPVTAGATTGG
jgi:catechol 2,3-dioxygenase-like lactoylglutathione lyase family enzyme